MVEIVRDHGDAVDYVKLNISNMKILHHLIMNGEFVYAKDRFDAIEIDGVVLRRVKFRANVQHVLNREKYMEKYIDKIKINENGGSDGVEGYYENKETSYSLDASYKFNITHLNGKKFKKHYST